MRLDYRTTELKYFEPDNKITKLEFRHIIKSVKSYFNIYT